MCLNDRTISSTGKEFSLFVFFLLILMNVEIVFSNDWDFQSSMPAHKLNIDIGMPIMVKNISADNIKLTIAFHFIQNFNLDKETTQ